MLQFNLSKVDRVVLHKRIASARITAKEISTMSSTDLANEETKQHIKIAEQEALEHSILQKTTAPRAKITHKGLQDIEDINGEMPSLRERDREREQQEEERMERERVARLRAAQAPPRQRTASVSVPPESPLTPQSAAWGGPPLVPVHAMSPATSELPPDNFGIGRPPVFLHSTPDVPMSDLEFNLDDLINMDDEPSSAQDATLLSPAVPADHTGDASSPSQAAVQVPVASTPVGISPFASNMVNPETPRSSFDLNSLWSAPKVDSPKDEAALSTTPPLPVASQEEERKDVVMEAPLHEASDDQDFDMFLEEGDQFSPEALQSAFDSSAQVWSGKVSHWLSISLSSTNNIFVDQHAP